MRHAELLSTSDKLIALVAYLDKIDKENGTPYKDREVQADLMKIAMELRGKDEEIMQLKAEIDAMKDHELYDAEAIKSFILWREKKREHGHLTLMSFDAQLKQFNEELRMRPSEPLKSFQEAVTPQVDDGWKTHVAGVSIDPMLWGGKNCVSDAVLIAAAFKLMKNYPNRPDRVTSWINEYNRKMRVCLDATPKVEAVQYTISDIEMWNAYILSQRDSEGRLMMNLENMMEDFMRGEHCHVEIDSDGE